MYLFIDTETTGIPKNWNAPISDLDNWPRLVQIAWLIFDSERKLIDEKNYIIRPEGFSIPVSAVEIHKITDEVAFATGNDLARVLKELSSAIDKVQFIIAHNMNFDEKIISAEFLRKNIEHSFSKKKLICTMEETTAFCAIPGNKGNKWPNLAELYFRLFGIQYNETHNAYADINATARCFWELYDKDFFVNIFPHSVSNKISNTLTSEPPSQKPLVITHSTSNQDNDLGVYHQTFAGFWKRFVAFLIDYSLIFLISSILAYFTNYEIPPNAKGPYSIFGYAIVFFTYPPGMIIAWLYYAIMESTKYQGTLGKLALKIKVTNDKGLKVSFGKATGRYFAKIFSGLFFGIGFIMIAFTARKQGLHDQMANCCVIRKY
jgi:uncharacterized RDD family membrane protein YckC/DNA polymerase III epsilon subunit-like protein